MKLIVKKSSLEVCVKNLVRVINTKNALPILGDILFDVNETAKTARLTASDSEVTLSTEVILDECEGGGRFCVGATTLAAMLAEVSEQPVTITATTESDQKFTITYAQGSAFCPLENADEYPMPQTEAYNEKLDGLKADYLRDALKRSMWATANDDLRPVMAGVNFALVDGSLDIVASDGHVMVKSSKAFANKIELNRCGSFIMPKKVANILTAIMEADDAVDIEWNNREAHIGLFEVDIYFRLIEGKYPNYNSIIPHDFAREVSCQRTALLSAVKAVAPFAPDLSNMVTMTFDGESLEVHGEDYDFAQGAKKSISTEGYDGERFDIGVKSSKMITILTKLSTSDVLLKLNDPSRAIILEPIDDDADEEITGLIMPMMLNE